MPLRFRCVCGQKLKAASDAVGRRAKCPKCEKWLRVPDSLTYDVVAEVVRPREKKSATGAEPSAPAKVSEKPHPPPTAEHKARILVADGNPSDRQRLVEMLQQHGYEVLEATDGAQAVEMIRAEKPALAILDVKLDILSGFRVIDQIRNLANVLNKDVWDTPIIMTADKLRGKDKQYAMSLGAVGYFAKPVLPAELCPRIEKALSKHAGGRGHTQVP